MGVLAALVNAAVATGTCVHTGSAGDDVAHAGFGSASKDSRASLEDVEPVGTLVPADDYVCVNELRMPVSEPSSEPRRAPR